MNHLNILLILILTLTIPQQSKSLIILGSKTNATTIDKITFTCPLCRSEHIGEIKEIQSSLTFFFIPLFPYQKGAKYLECTRCKTCFNLQALNNEGLKKYNVELSS